MLIETRTDHRERRSKGLGKELRRTQQTHRKRKMNHQCQLPVPRARARAASSRGQAASDRTPGTPSVAHPTHGAGLVYPPKLEMRGLWRRNAPRGGQFFRQTDRWTDGKDASALPQAGQRQPRKHPGVPHWCPGCWQWEGQASSPGHDLVALSSRCSEGSWVWCFFGTRSEGQQVILSQVEGEAVEFVGMEGWPEGPHGTDSMALRIRARGAEGLIRGA